jgi:N6-L-threonylcarbamoyladenine synthase
MIILGIESSCDETAAAVLRDGKVLANPLFSQVDLHKRYGGVVPEIASRSHIEKISFVVEEALNTAHILLDDIDAIAVTNRPGLPGSLLVGLCFAKSLAYARNKPLIGVNHIEGHIFSACIENTIPFPFICLTASGGHTALFYVTDYGKYTCIGTTADDAAGEAFDKIAKLLNLGYPGGPQIEKLAHEGSYRDYRRYPRLRRPDTHFSFSGIKTAVLYDMIKRGEYDHENKILRANDTATAIEIASSLLVAVGDIFVDRVTLALQRYPAAALTFVGGVACNKYLRTKMQEVAQYHGLIYAHPAPHLCTDNAAMIAFVGNYKALRGEYDPLTLDIFPAQSI